MEDILHSIRDIIADGVPDTAKEQQPVANPPANSAAPEEDILELTDIIPTSVDAISAEPATASPVAQEQAPIDSAPPSAENKDILADIDNALGVNNEEQIQATQEPAVTVIEEPVPTVAEISPPVEQVSQPVAVSVETKEEVVEQTVQIIEDKTPLPPQNSGERLISDISAKATEAALKALMENLPKPKIESPEFRSGNTLEDIVLEALKPMLSQWLDKNLPTIVEQLVQKEIRKLVPRE